MKSLKAGIIIFVALSLVLAIALSGCPSKEPTVKELKIGSLAVLTGPGSSGVAPQDDGVHGAAEWINENGGLTINGEKYLLKVITEDTKDSTEGMVAATNKLVYQDKVKFILNCTPSLTILKAALPMLEENKVIVFNGEGLGVPDFILPEFTYEFYSPMCTSAYMCSMDAFKKLYPEVKTFVSMTTEGEEFQKEVVQIEKALAVDPNGPRIVSYGTYPMGSSDYYPAWTKVLAEGEQPDGLIMCMGIAQWYAGVLKQGRELGFTGPYLGMGIGADPYIVADLAGEYATNMLQACFDFQSPEMPAGVKEAKQFMKDKYGQDLIASHFIGWEQMYILADVIDQAQSLDTAKVRDFWANMTVVNTPVGPGSMSGMEYYGTNNVVIRPMPMCTIMNGVVEHYGWGDGSLPPAQK